MGLPRSLLCERRCDVTHRTLEPQNFGDFGVAGVEARVAPLTHIHDFTCAIVTAARQGAHVEAAGGDASAAWWLSVHGTSAG